MRRHAGGDHSSPRAGAQTVDREDQEQEWRTGADRGQRNVFGLERPYLARRRGGRGQQRGRGGRGKAQKHTRRDSVGCQDEGGATQGDEAAGDDGEPQPEFACRSERHLRT